MKKLRMILIVFFIFGLSATGYSSEGCLLFNGTFERSTKTSATNVLSVQNSETQIGQFKAVDGGALVRVYNGAQEDEAQKVSSATIFINGKKVIGPSNFNQNADYIEKMVEVNSGDNSLEVSMKSKPGGKIKVVILQPNILALSASDGHRAASVCSGDSTYPDKVITQFNFKVDQYADIPEDGDIAVSPDGNYLYVTDSSDDTLKVIEIASKLVIRTIKVGTNPHRLAVSPDGKYVYVSNLYSSSVSVIPTDDNGVNIPPVNVDDWAYDVAVSPDGNYVYVSLPYAGKVSIIPTSDIQTSDPMVTTIEPVENPTSLAVSPDGKQVYACSFWSGNVLAIQTSQTSNNEVTPISVGTTTHRGIGVTPDGTYIYVSNSDDSGLNNSVSVIQTFNNEVTTISDGIGSYPTGIAVTPFGKYVYVSNKAGNSVSIIQASNNTVIKTIEGVGNGPNRIAVSPDGRYVYVRSYYNYGGTVSVIGHQD